MAVAVGAPKHPPGGSTRSSVPMPPKPSSKLLNSLRAWLCHGKYHSPQTFCEVTSAGRVPLVPRYGLPLNHVLLSLKVRFFQSGLATLDGSGLVDASQKSWSVHLNRKHSV